MEPGRGGRREGRPMGLGLAKNQLQMIVVLLAGAFVAVLNATLLTPALPTIMADMGIARYLIADAIVGVIAQRLVRRLCPHCRKERPATDKEKRILRRSQAEEVKIWEPGGCKLCNNTGYFGRTGVFEIMEVSENMRRMIAEDAPTEDLIAEAKRTGMKTLRENGIRYVLDGTTSIAEMLKASYEE